MASNTKAKRNSSKKNVAPKQKSGVKSEFKSLMIIVLGLILGALLYIPSGLIGPEIRRFFLGLLGVPVYLFPILLVVNGFHMATSKSYEDSKKKYYLAAAGIFVLSSIFTLFSLPPQNPFTSFMYYWDYGTNAAGGGILGGIICDVFAKPFGSPVAGIILFAAFIVIIMVLTKWSPLKALLRGFVKLYLNIKKVKKSAQDEIHQIGIEELNQKGKKGRETKKANKSDDIENKTPVLKKPYDDEEYLPPSLRNVVIDDDELSDIETNIDDIVNSVMPEYKQIDIEKTDENNDEIHHEYTDDEEVLEKKELVPEKITGMEDVSDEIEQAFERIPYTFPSTELLKDPSGIDNGEMSRTELKETAQKLVVTLKSFNVDAKLINVSKGPTVTRYELKPGDGVKVSKIVGLSDDIALRLAASGVRIEAPIPNKEAIGIEIPNKTVDTVYIKEVIASDEFKKFDSNLAFALGKDITGKNIVVDLSKMPHLLIAGATGSGKSVCINTLITSLIYKSDPNEVKLLMVDPKVVELGVYNGIPHLLIPVVTDPRRASGALYWAVQEMLRRYTLFADRDVRNIKGYNELLKEEGNENILPHIVIIIDELADLMMVAPGEVEDSICRLAQMARAAGMHLVIATQRPSVDVITGLIKANIPSRIAFAVSSQVDSRTILDAGGAEKLLGRGDMLFSPMGAAKPTRIQGAFISDKEVENIVEFIKGASSARYDEDIIEKIDNGKPVNIIEKEEDSDSDELLPKAIEIAVDTGKISASYIQRRLKVGFSRAARIIDQMEERGLIGPPDGSKPREVLITKEDYLEMSINS